MKRTSVSTDPKAIDRVLTRGVHGVIEDISLKAKLRSGKRLCIKHGVDPTGNRLHLGHAVIYEKLRQFQELGHTIVFLIGGFTGRFGDPTDRDTARTMRKKSDVEKAGTSYLKQLSALLDVDRVELRSNSEWYDTMSAEELLRLLSSFTVSRMLERDMFTKRLKAGKEVQLHELAYPALQGYDSVMLKSDATIIGTDQLFNELQARPLQEAAGQKPQDVMTMPLLIGLDGSRKMSQSYGNDIAFTDTPNDMFGKVMSIPDHLILPYFELVTRVSDDDLAAIRADLSHGKNQRDTKARLAREIVTLFHGAAHAAKAEQEFNTVFRDKKRPTIIPTARLSTKRLPVIDLLVQTKLTVSKSEARRLIVQGGVKIDDTKVTDPNAAVSPKGKTIQVGKRKFVRVQ